MDFLCSAYSEKGKVLGDDDMILILRKSSLFFLGTLSLLSVMVYRVYTGPEVVAVSGLSVSSKVVVIDAGHGGRDPGKVGSEGKKTEKEINLEIALKLQKLFEQSGAVVVMTRIDDERLEGDAPKGSRKNAELRARRILTNESQGDLLISIHQNSFTEASSRGAQTFYYGNSNESKLLAKTIQEKITTYVDPKNKRKYKGNNSYAMLKNTKIPAVIVECGFMSNPEEEALLNDPKYQNKIAEAIYSGVKEYFIELEKIRKGQKSFASILGKEAYFPSSNTQ